MARRLGLVILGSAIVAAWAFGQTKPGKPAAAPAAASAPAAKNAPGKKPLLLLDDDEKPDPASKHMADNSRCYVCHTNFQKEALVVTHARAQIGCTKCHGACDAHIDDESWTSGGKGTPPDKMYVRAKVIPFCVTCHDRSATDASDCPFPKMKQKQVCTDCHGKHRLSKRKCKWK
jgi:hypothetical protein